MRATTINNYFVCRCGSRERKGSAKGLCKRCYAAERWRAQNPDKRRRVPAREGLVSINTLIHWSLNDRLQAIADRHNVTKAVLLNLALLEGARDLGRLEALVHMAPELLRRRPDM